MRSVALIALLAYCGSYVPADTCSLGPIDRIFTRIGASDDLASGHSTFMVEMMEAATVLRTATEQSLVLMDEIGRGTSTLDGLALAKAICLYLLQKNRALTLFATHYFELTQLSDPHLANVHLGTVEHQGTIVFLHALKPGPASQSYGIHVAQLAGLPRSVILHASQLLRALEELRQLVPLQSPEREAPSSSVQVITPLCLSNKAVEWQEWEVARKVFEQLKTVDIQTLSPRAALELLFELKQQIALSSVKKGEESYKDSKEPVRDLEI